MATNMRHRSWTWGSEAALRSTVWPLARQCCHQRVFGGHHAHLREEDVLPGEAAGGAHGVAIGAHLDLRAELAQRIDVGVHRAPADLVAAGGGQLGQTGAREQRAGQHEAGADLLAELRRRGRLAEGEGLHAQPAGRLRVDLCAQVGECGLHRGHVADLGDIRERNGLVRQQRGCDHRESCVLVSRDADLARQRPPAFDE